MTNWYGLWLTLVSFYHLQLPSKTDLKMSDYTSWLCLGLHANNSRSKTRLYVTMSIAVSLERYPKTLNKNVYKTSNKYQGRPLVLLVVMAVTTMSLLVKLTYISKRCWDSLVKQKNSKSTFTNPVETHTELKQHLIRLMSLFYERDNIKFIWNRDLLYKIFSKHFNLNHTKHFDNTYHWIIYILFYIIQHQHKTRTNVSYWLSWSHHFERFAVATMAWLTVMEYLCHEYVPLVVSTSRSFPHSCLITVFVARLTRRVPLVEQELLSLSGAPEFIPGFKWGSRYSIFSFMCMFCRSMIVLLYLFFWPLCCRVTDYDYSFGIFKLFF